MRIHTNTANTIITVHEALQKAQDAGLVARHVYFDKCEGGRSKTHTGAAEVHLTAAYKEPGSKRRRPSSGRYGFDGNEAWAATWDEWGWFFSALFVIDPTAKVADYPTREVFHSSTAGKYLPVRASRAVLEA